MIASLFVDDAQLEKVKKALKELVSPLVSADGGTLYFVKATADGVHVHLTGTCAGCPGVTMTRDALVEPVVRSVAASAKVTLTTGPLIPDGAKKLD